MTHGENQVSCSHGSPPCDDCIAREEAAIDALHDDEFCEDACYRCGGSGTVDRRISDDPNDDVEVDCPVCGGSGDMVAPNGQP